MVDHSDMRTPRRQQRPRRTFLVLLLLLACVHATPDPTAPPPALRVMTFNIRYGTAPDGDHVWALRRPLVERVINDFNPVVLGVQEALHFQLNDLAETLRQYEVIGVGRDDGRQLGEYSAILYDRLRLEPLQQGTFWLSDTPERPGSMTWGNRYVRIATWARFRDRATRATFYVFNTHWDHESQPAREKSAALILQRIAQRSFKSEPVLLMGDFNAGEDNAAFRTLLGGGQAPAPVSLFDTFRALHPNATDVGTYHAFKGNRTGAKIDAILATPGFRVLDAGLVHLVENGRYPSDHFPVTATVTLGIR